MAVAPEPYLSASMEVLYQASLASRDWGWSGDVPAEHLAHLMDATHNLPHLVRDWERCDVAFLRKSFLLVYQQKWAYRGGLALCDIFDGRVAEQVKLAEQNVACDRGSQSMQLWCQPLWPPAPEPGVRREFEMHRYRSRFIGAVLVSALTSLYSSAAPPEKGGDVKPAELAALIDRADKLVVLDTPLEKAPALYESNDRKDLDSLKASMKLRAPERGYHCLCYGTPAVALYERGKRIGLITNHHGVFIRCDLWASDAVLTDSEPMLKWFDDRKIPGPRKEFDLDVKLRKQADADEKRWLAAMPPSLKPHWEAATRSFTPDLEPMQKALAEQVKDKKARILALSAWYGSGAGPWSGFPAYESVARELLMGYSTAELLEAIKERDLSKPETEGVARLFGGWDFSQQRPDDLALVPAELKAKLLKHSVETDNEDKRGRARRAFGK